jgi:hypothetical protein
VSASQPRLPQHDPRTLARNIPGLLEALFPSLLPGVVASLNRRAVVDRQCEPVLLDKIQATSVSRPMLFELSSAVAEQLLTGSVAPDWHAALNHAVARQSKYFDARVPTTLDDCDKEIALRVARNLVSMLVSLQAQLGQQTEISPPIPGYQWIASGAGDFSIGTHLIEVKCTSRHFSSADYRQVLMYWILSYLNAIEQRGHEWSHVILLSPRHCRSLHLSFNELIHLFGGGRSKVDLVCLFEGVIEDHKLRA